MWCQHYKIDRKPNTFPRRDLGNRRPNFHPYGLTEVALLGWGWSVNEFEAWRTQLLVSDLQKPLRIEVGVAAAEGFWVTAASWAKAEATLTTAAICEAHWWLMQACKEKTTLTLPLCWEGALAIANTNRVPKEKGLSLFPAANTIPPAGKTELQAVSCSLPPCSPFPHLSPPSLRAPGQSNPSSVTAFLADITLVLIHSALREERDKVREYCLFLREIKRNSNCC